MSDFNKLIGDVFSSDPESSFCLLMAKRAGCTLQYMTVDHLGMSARFQCSLGKSAYLSVSNEGKPELFVRSDDSDICARLLIKNISDLEGELKSHFVIAQTTFN
jgi:hypothetical protein